MGRAPSRDRPEHQENIKSGCPCFLNKWQRAWSLDDCLITLWPPWLKFFPSISAERVRVSPWRKNIIFIPGLLILSDCSSIGQEDYLHQPLLVAEANLTWVIHLRPHTCLGRTLRNRFSDVYRALCQCIIASFEMHLNPYLPYFDKENFHLPHCRVHTLSPLQSLCYC